MIPPTPSNRAEPPETRRMTDDPFTWVDDADVHPMTNVYGARFRTADGVEHVFYGHWITHDGLRPAGLQWQFPVTRCLNGTEMATIYPRPGISPALRRIVYAAVAVMAMAVLKLSGVI